MVVRSLYGALLADVPAEIELDCGIRCVVEIDLIVSFYSTQLIPANSGRRSAAG